MTTNKKTIFLVFSFLLLSAVPFLLMAQKDAASNVHQGSHFNFVLSDSSVTSAGVYTKDSVLIRTLWSGKSYGRGNTNGFWDGKDDEGNLAEAGSYTIKVLSNKVHYSWEGVIGNTSDSLTGSTVYNGFGRMNGMAIVGNTAYYSKAYSEGSPSYAKFNIHSPQQKQWVGLYKPITLSTLFVASDGINVYWSNVFYRDTSNCFVTATKVADDGEVIFTKGLKFTTKWGGEFKSVIDFYNGNNAVPTGLAVQQKGKCLFIAHGSENMINVVDKVTGGLINVIALQAPSCMAVDKEDDIWISFKENGISVVKKFSILEQGRLSEPLLTLKGIEAPLAMAVSPTNQVVVVADGGANQQLKAFNNQSGDFEWVFGKHGGYFVDPTVGFDKFYFTDNRPAQIGTLQTFIAFEPNGTFWVEDAGNCRALHYTADRKLINQIMYLPAFYSCVVDLKNPSRIFADFLEFSVDYDKPLLPNNGSWKLVNNWGAVVPDSLDDHFDRLMGLTTLQNGRTYALVNKLKASLWEVVELPKQGPLRFTGIQIPINLRRTRLFPSGDLRTTPRCVIGKPLVWTQKRLVGFDVANNPVWGDEEVFAKSPPFTKDDPANWGYGIMHAWEVTTSGVLVSFDNGMPPGGGTGYHLGGLNPLTGKWLWKTAMATTKTYSGEYPSDGAYDIGNSAQYGGSLHLINGRNIFWGYHGEFWKGNQVNKWNHIWDDGLFVGQFGATGLDDPGEAPPRMAGNVLGADIVHVKDGELYLYHNDEGRHGGLHRWKITGLNSIVEQSMPVNVTSTGNGLFATTYSDTSFNNASISSSYILLGAKIQLPQVFAGRNVPAKKMAVRLCGFVKPITDGVYYFSTDATTGTKLEVNGRLLANSISPGAGTDSSGIFLNAGKQYPVTIQCTEVDGSNLPQLFWRSNTFPKQPVPLSQLSPDLSRQSSNGTINLMEGLAYNSILENGQYGWTRYPIKQDSTNKYSQWWSVATGVKKYQKLESPDIFIVRKQDTGVAFVYRKFRDNDEPVTGWKLHGQIWFDKNLLNRLVSPVKDVGGCYFEILDKNGKILLRFYPTIMGYPNDIRFYLNNQLMLQSNFNDFKRYIEHGNTIDVRESNGKLILQFENLPPVSVDRYDLSASVDAPNSMGMYFWGRGGNTVKVVDLADFYFYH